MKKCLGVLAVALVMSAGCGGSPTSPSSSPLGTFGADISSRCSAFPNLVTSVVVTIDGVVAGSATPGGPAITKRVGTGNHSVSGIANNGIKWSTDNRTLTASAPDFIVTLACL